MEISSRSFFGSILDIFPNRPQLPFKAHNRWDDSCLSICSYSFSHFWLLISWEKYTQTYIHRNLEQIFSFHMIDHAQMPGTYPCQMAVQLHKHPHAHSSSSIRATDGCTVEIPPVKVHSKGITFFNFSLECLILNVFYSFSPIASSVHFF